jgi:branched-chain amino acid transport system substrate-binding protein
MKKSEGLSRRDIAKLGAAAPLLLAFPGLARSAESSTIKIGVPLPISGAVANLGNQVKDGMELAVEQINAAGGLLGKKVELDIVDTKSEPNVAATVATGMATSGNVDLFVGGMGSTPDFAMLTAIKRYAPIFVEIGSGSDKLEQAFGAEPWYFHVNPWDYYRQIGIENFLASLDPQPKRIAFAYEDGLNGTTASKTAAAGLEGKYELVMNEPFKSGSPDLSSILSRIKASNADVVIITGYAPDYLLFRRQQKELGVYPKLTLIFGGGQTPEDFGDLGNNMASLDVWSPALNVPGVSEFVDQVKSSGRKLGVFVTVGYAGMQSVAQAIKNAGSLDRDKLLAALGGSKFDTVFGEVGFGPSRKGGQHQLLNQDNILVMQYQDGKEQVVFPTKYASAKLVYPVNDKNEPA